MNSETPYRGRHVVLQRCYGDQLWTNYTKLVSDWWQEIHHLGAGNFTHFPKLYVYLYMCIILFAFNSVISRLSVLALIRFWLLTSCVNLIKFHIIWLLYCCFIALPCIRVRKKKILKAYRSALYERVMFIILRILHLRHMSTVPFFFFFAPLLSFPSLDHYSPIPSTLSPPPTEPSVGRPQKKVTWASALKGQPHAPLQIFHLIKYTSIVSHTCEAALTWAKVTVTRVIFNLLFEAGNCVFRATVLMRVDGQEGTSLWK